MALQHAVLALLADGPSYGYELKATFEKTVGPQWGGLNIGHMYQILDRLRRDGYATVQTVPQDGRGTDPAIYRITQAGRTVLEEWFETPTARTSGYRDDFILKVMAAGHRSPDDVRHVCEIQREARLAELQTLRAHRRTHQADAIAALTIEAAIAHVQADLKLIDIAESRAEDAVAATIAPSERRFVEAPQRRASSG